MSNLNCYYAEDCQFDSFFGWLRATQHCACNKCRLLPTCRLLQSTVNLQSQNWTESYSNLQSENWTESWEEFQQKMINSNPNLFKQKWWHPNLSMYWNVATSKCMFISGHFHVLGTQKAHFQCNAKREVAVTSPRFCNEHHLLHVLFCEGCTWHHLRILVKAPLFCDWKSRATSAQCFSLSHRATIKIPHRVHLISASSRHTGVVFQAHPVRGESHIHHNANWEVATLTARLG